MHKFSNGDLVTAHFDIFDDCCILDLPLEFGWQLQYYHHHHLMKVETYLF